MAPAPTRRLSQRIAGVTSAAVATALLASPPAQADAPPGCTAADLASVATGVAASTSGYLFGHPDVNEFYTNLHNLPQSEVPEAVRAYFDANPQAHTDLLAIRQPLVDFRSRCGLPQPERPLLGE